MPCFISLCCTAASEKFIFWKKKTLPLWSRKDFSFLFVFIVLCGILQVRFFFLVYFWFVQFAWFLFSTKETFVAIKRQMQFVLSGRIASTSSREFEWTVLSKDSANLGFSAYAATDFSVTLNRSFHFCVLQIPTCQTGIMVFASPQGCCEDKCN